MAGDVVPTVGHLPIRARLVFYGWLQFGPGSVTVVAEVRLVTHVADFNLLRGNRPMIFHEHRGVHITPVGHILIGIIVAVRTVFQVFALLFRVKRGRVPSFLGSGTGQYITN